MRNTTKAEKAVLNKELLQLMKSRKGGEFPADVATDWYIARKYALRHLQVWEQMRRNLSSGPMRLYIPHADTRFSMILARQLSLLMHHPGFQEGDRNTRTVITLLYDEPKTLAELNAEVEKLSADEYLCNLIVYADYTLCGTDRTDTNDKSLPYLDIEFELISNKKFTQEEKKYLLADITEIKKELNIGDSNKNAPKEFTMQDMQRGMMVNNAYCLGATIDNLPNCDNATPLRYNIALDYLRGTKREEREKEWQKPFTSDGNGIGQIDLRNRLSCIFSGDLFESHVRSVMNYYDKIDYKYLLTHGNEIRRAISANLEPLARTEHARWNVEKLIMGFRPFNEKEALEDELALQGRNAHRKKLKNRTEDPAHIDIASYSDLKRINPQDMKYDHFIILAIPYILRKVLHNPES